MSRASDANGHRWRQARAGLAARGDGCWICRAFGRPDAIDYALPAGDPRAFEADHLVPVSKGGSLTDPDNLAATHRACNNWRRNRSVAEVIAIARRGTQGVQTVEVTTDW